MKLRAQKYLSTPRDTSTVTRAMAFIIDRCIIALLTSVLLILIYFAIFGNMGDQNNPVILSELPKNIRIVTNLFFLFLVLSYKIFIPSIKIGKKVIGQSVGKYVMHIQVVTHTNSQVTIKDLFVRELFVILFVEFSARFYDIHVFIRELMFLCLNINLPMLIEYSGTIIVISSIIYCVFIDKQHRMIHDILAKTKIMPID